MKEKSYSYTGPNSAVTIIVTDAKGESVQRDVMLWCGRDVTLPEDHAYTQQLLAQGLITPVAPAAAVEPAPAPAPAPAVAKKSAAAPTTTAE
jgi:hypothetical protein